MLFYYSNLSRIRHPVTKRKLQQILKSKKLEETGQAPEPHMAGRVPSSDRELKTSRINILNALMNKKKKK